MMWQVAYADGQVSNYQDNLIWRAADLLGVSSRERIALRQRIAEARKGGDRMTAGRYRHRRFGRDRRRTGASCLPATAMRSCWWRGARRSCAALASEIAATGGPRPIVLPLDLSQPGAAAADRRGAGGAASSSRSTSSTTQALAWSARPTALDRDEQLAMIDLNVRALTELSLAFVDSLWRAAAAAFSTSPRSRASCRDRDRRSITRARPTCCRSARRCIAN